MDSGTPQIMEVVVTKAKTKVAAIAEKKGVSPKVAWFRSFTSSSLRLVIKPIKENYFPGVGMRMEHGSGEDVQFDNYLYKTDVRKVINWLMKHEQFEIEFGPDPFDPSGYWKESGWFEEKSTRYLAPAKKQEAVLKTAGEQAQVVVESLRTSDTGPGVPK